MKAGAISLCQSRRFARVILAREALQESQARRALQETTRRRPAGGAPRGSGGEAGVRRPALGRRRGLGASWCSILANTTRAPHHARHTPSRGARRTDRRRPAQPKGRTVFPRILLCMSTTQAQSSSALLAPEQQRMHLRTCRDFRPSAAQSSTSWPGLPGCHPSTTPGLGCGSGRCPCTRRGCLRQTPLFLSFSYICPEPVSVK